MSAKSAGRLAPNSSSSAQDSSAQDPRTPKSLQSKNLLYLAVVPVYRDACMRLLLGEHGSNVEVLAGNEHLDSTVKTGLPEEMVGRIRNVPLFGRRALLQVGGWKKALRANVCVVDLNPRSLTAWAICITRRVLRKRTLVWGHLHPRAGADSKTAPLRVLLRRLAHGTILYGYDSVVPARTELPAQPVWVAPNSLYPAERIQHVIGSRRRAILYVGRLERAKNVDFLVEAFAKSELSREGYTLDIVGSGSLEPYIRSQAESLGVSDSVKMHGRIDDVDKLRHIYSTAAFSVSPGYVGLSLTQSLGFGVPMLYASDAPHAPEIELMRFGGTRSFGPTDIDALGHAMAEWARELSGTDLVDGQALASNVRKYYAAENMANGIWDALNDRPVDYGIDGWPVELDGTDEK